MPTLIVPAVPLDWIGGTTAIYRPVLIFQLDGLPLPIFIGDMATALVTFARPRESGSMHGT